MKILIKTLTDFKSKLEPFLKNVIKKLTSKKLEEAVDYESENYAKRFLTQIRINIVTNAFNFKLKPETIKRKKGGYTAPWVDTMELYRAIERDGHVVLVRNNKRISKRSKGLTNRELAMILEYGRKDLGIPPRPIFRLTLRKFKAVMSKDLTVKCKRSKNK